MGAWVGASDERASLLSLFALSLTALWMNGWEEEEEEQEDACEYREDGETGTHTILRRQFERERKWVDE